MTPLLPTSTLLLALLAASHTTSAVPAARAGSGGEVALQFAPAAGTTRSTQVVLSQLVDGGELTVVMDDQEVPETYLPELRLAYDDERSFSVEEVFLQGSAAGPSEWLRHYASIDHTNLGSFSVTMSGQEQEQPWDVVAGSDLAGAVLRIEAGDGELTQTLVDGEPAPPGLRLDLSFAALLPGAPVAVGASWKIEDESLAFLLEPGGDLGVVLDEQAKQNLFPVYDTREHSGELTLTLVAHEDGRARIELEGELTRTSVGPGDLSQVPVVDGAATDTTTVVYDLAGEMIWDTAAQALAELELGGRLASDTITLRDPELPGPTYESSFSFGGEWGLVVTCAAAESSVLEAAAAR